MIGLRSDKNVKAQFLLNTNQATSQTFDEKYAHLICVKHLGGLLIFEVLSSDCHSGGPRNLSVAKVDDLCFFLFMLCHFVPKYIMNMRLIKY